MNPRLSIPAGTALVCAVAALLVGCNRPAPAAENIADTATFEAFVEAAVHQKADTLKPEELNQAVEQFLGLQVAAAAATKAGLEKDPKVQAQINLNRTNILTEALLKQHLDANPVTEAEIDAEYKEQVANVPKEYKASHILVDDKSLAEAIIKKLKASKNVAADFAAQAKEFSKDSSAAKGGDLGWFNAQTMVKPFADAVVAMDKGQFSEVPVETQFGYHVILLEDVRTPQLPELAEVKDQVKQLVQRKRVRDYLEELKKGSKLDLQKAADTLVAYAQVGEKSGKQAEGKPDATTDAGAGTTGNTSDAADSQADKAATPAPNAP